MIPPALLELVTQVHNAHDMEMVVKISSQAMGLDPSLAAFAWAMYVQGHFDERPTPETFRLLCWTMWAFAHIELQTIITNASRASRRS